MDELIDWLVKEFSPRMRGCFLVVADHHQSGAVLPAYAGMFPRLRRSSNLGIRSPRVCGDVSIRNAQNGTSSSFSPRMRGCFLVPVTPRCTCGVLPAYAGMFLLRSHFGVISPGSPRVCGDVSKPEDSS